MNIERLRAVEAHILAEPKRIHMARWNSIGEAGETLLFPIDFPLDEDDDIDEDSEEIHPNFVELTVPACNTIGCISGWGQFLFDPNTSPYHRNDLFDLTVDQGDKLFYSDAWPAEFRERLLNAKVQTTEYAQVVVDRIEHFIKTNGAEGYERT